MTNRVVLGFRAEEPGLWISKPYRNVMAISHPDDFLFTARVRAAQIVQSGRIGFDPYNPNADLWVPDLGYRPMINWYALGSDTVVMHCLANNHFRFSAPPALPAVYDPWPPSPYFGATPVAFYIWYQVWSLPQP